MREKEKYQLKPSLKRQQNMDQQELNTELESYVTKVFEFEFKAAKGHAKTNQRADKTV